MPCLSALKRVLSFPALDVGPVLFWLLRRLASARFDEVVAVSLTVCGPIGGKWIGEVSSSSGMGVSLAPSLGFAIFSLYYSYRKLFGLSWNFFGIISEFLGGRPAMSGALPVRLRPKCRAGLDFRR